MDARNDTVFSPAFGNRPTSLVGRKPVIDGFLAGLASRPGSKERATAFLGQRGYGKTVLLWELADRAREAGFAVASPTSVREGLVKRVAEKLEDDAADVVGRGKLKLAGGSVGAVGFSAGVQFARDDDRPETDEARLTRTCRTLTEHGRGALLLIDELQANSPEIRSLVGTYQELVGEGLDVAIALAGLPASTSSVLNDRVLTFLNRARKVEIGSLPPGEVEAFMTNGLETCGVSMNRSEAKAAAEATCGSPYLMQLIGHYLVLFADGSGNVSAVRFDEALEAAREEYRNDVCETTIAPLSATDVRYLVAMARLGGGCRSSEVARSMGVSADYGQQYRRRLIDAGIIRAPQQGVVEFAVPLLEDYLKGLDDA